MAAPESDSTDHRRLRPFGVLWHSCPFVRALAYFFGRLATSHGCDPYCECLCQKSDARRLRDWPGHLGIPPVRNDFWYNLRRTKTDQAKLLSRALGAERSEDASKLLLDRTGSLQRLLLTNPDELVRMGGNRSLARQIGAIKELALELIRSDEAKPYFPDAHSIARYLCADMGHLRIENLRVMFMDAHNRLILDETMWRGTINEVIIHTREVLKRALEVDASAFILAHNHPSGILSPSDNDLALTREMLSAAAALGIVFHDHLIVTAGGVVSLRLERLIEPWR